MAMQPQAATALSREPYLRALVLGGAKTGKTTTLVSTSPGPVYVINCDKSEAALQGARRRTKNFDYNNVNSYNELLEALKIAKEGAKAGRYKTVILDTLSSFATSLEMECLRATENNEGMPDGRRAYPDYERRLRHLMESAFRIEAHFIAISHYLAIGADPAENGAAKFGDGVAPLLAGKARATVPMLFGEVVFFDMRKGERILICNPQGAWGPGSRSLEGSEVLKADVGVWLAAIEEQANADAKSPGRSVPSPKAEAQARPTSPARPATTRR